VVPGLTLAPFFLWALANLWHAGREVARFYIDLPVWDYWNTIQHYTLYKAGDLRVLWVQHNEHRIVFPEIIFAVDLLVFHGHIILPTVLSCCFYFGVWVLMAWAFFRDREVALIPRYAAIFLAAILIAWKGCAAALGIPFLLQWTMNQYFTVLALIFLAKLCESRRALWLVMLCVSAVVCNYTSGNGLMLWPLLIGFAVFLRLPWRYTAILGLAGALSVGLYFVGYQSLGPVNWRALMEHPVYFAKFMASYVCMPFGALQGDPAFGVRVGLTSLVALSALLLIAWRDRLLGTTTGIVLFGYLACVLLSGVMTALGRMNPNDPLLQSPKAVRYMTMPLTYWGALAIVSIWITARFFRSLGTKSAAILAVGLGLLLFRMSHKPRFDAWYDAVTTSFADQQWAALAVESGVLDPVPDRILFPDPNFVPSVAPLMRAERLSLFSQAEPFWMGRDMKAVFPAALRAPQAGGVMASEPLETAVTVAGWTVAGSSLDKPLELVLVDESNRIVGLGARLPAGLPPRFSKLKIVAAQQWCGFVNPAYHSHTVSPYVLTGDHKALIPLAGGFTIAPR
jgi:hypothetical protein